MPKAYFILRSNISLVPTERISLKKGLHESEVLFLGVLNLMARMKCLKTVIFNYYNQLNNVISNNIKDYLRVEIGNFLYSNRFISIHFFVILYHFIYAEFWHNKGKDLICKSLSSCRGIIMNCIRMSFFRESC